MSIFTKIFGTSLEPTRVEPTVEKISTDTVQKDANAAAQAAIGPLGAGFGYNYAYGPSYTGEPVTHITALQCAAVYACIDVVSKSIAKLPLHMYRKLKPRGTEIEFDHPVAALLVEPNSYQTPSQFWSQVVVNQQLRGEAFIWIRRDNAGNPIELVPLNNSRVNVLVDTKNEGTLIYTFTHRLFQGQTFTKFPEDIIHLKNALTDDDGIHGISPVSAASNVIGMALATQKFAAILFKNGAVQRGIISGNKSGPDGAYNIAAAFAQAYSGTDNAHGVAVMPEGLKYDTIQSNAEETQLLESRKYIVEEIARLYGVPQSIIGGLDHATFSNIVEQNKNFIDYALLPIAKGIEEALTKLLFRSEKAKYFFKFDFDEMKEPSLKERYDTYQIATLNGILSRNECREMEGYNPVADGDEFRVPMNTENPAQKPSPTSAEEIEPAINSTDENSDPEDEI